LFVEIKFSRHAKRRAKLYQIPEATILKVLEGKELTHGNHEIIEYVEGFKYPLKIVVTMAYNNSKNKLSPEERKKRMKVYYDDEVDALYLKLGDETPEGVIEISEGVNLDTTSEDKIVGIEILDASKKIDLKTMLSYTLEFEKDLIIQKTA